MFQAGLQERIQLMEPALVEISNACIHLTEKGEGQADLEVWLCNQCILIRNLEKNKMEYFTNKKCADYVVFERTGTNWIAHVFEMKRTVKKETWEKEIKYQFRGAMQNILAFSGILGIQIEDIILHTAYRNDKINNIANPAKQHLDMYHRNKESTDWNNREISLDFLEKRSFKHDKIKLDIETGEGKYSL